MNFAYDDNPDHIIRIMNLGNTCYLSSALQLLLSIEPLIVTLNKIIPSDNNPTSLIELIRGIKKLYKNYSEDPSQILIWKPSAFYRSWTTDFQQFEPFQIGDCDDAFNSLVSLLEHSPSTMQLWKEFEKSMMINTVTKIFCTKCNHSIKKETNSLTCTVAPETDSITTIRMPIMEKLQTYKCDNCGETSCCSQNQHSFENTENLIIRIARFNFENGMMRKNNEPVDIPPKMRIKGKIFTLKTIVNHHGRSMNGGHYTTIQIPINKPDTQFLIDDAMVHEIESANVSRTAYILHYSASAVW